MESGTKYLIDIVDFHKHFKIDISRNFDFLQA